MPPSPSTPGAPVPPTMVRPSSPSRPFSPMLSSPVRSSASAKSRSVPSRVITMFSSLLPKSTVPPGPTLLLPSAKAPSSSTDTFQPALAVWLTRSNCSSVAARPASAKLGSSRSVLVRPVISPSSALIVMLVSPLATSISPAPTVVLGLRPLTSPTVRPSLFISVSPVVTLPSSPRLMFCASWIDRVSSPSATTPMLPSVSAPAAPPSILSVSFSESSTSSPESPEKVRPSFSVAISPSL